MLELSPGQKKFLDKIGVNTTRLQWKLYEREKRREEDKKSEKKSLPAGLRWMNYAHKFCPECGGLVDRDEKICPACGSRVQSMAVYKFMRTLGLVVPQGAAVTMMSFIVVMLGLYLLSILIQGPSAIMRPSNATLYYFGFQSPSLIRTGQYWRLLSFGLFHSGLIHIGFNTFALVQIGPMIERELGAKRMLVLITFTQITSALAVHLFTRHGAVGASGWLFGLIGFGISYYHRHGGSSHVTRGFFIQWAIYGLVFGFLLRFNNAAHIGGMAGGLALGMTADLIRARRTTWTALWEYLTWPCLGLWLFTLFQLARSILSS